MLFLVHDVEDEIVSDKFVQLLLKHNVSLCPTLIVADGYLKTFIQKRKFSTYDLRYANPEALGSLEDLKHLPDSQMKHLVDYIESGKPIIGLRTATHAFNISGGAYKKYTWGNKDKDFDGGFGRHVLGETWVAHHGNHGKEGTRGIAAKGEEKNVILKGIDAGSIFGTTDVYTAKPPADCKVLVFGEVTETLKPDSKAVAGKKNDPMMPIAWTRNYKTETGQTARIFTTTMGSADDLSHEGTRRMLVNASYWALALEEKIADKSKVDLVGEYKPTPFRAKKNEDWKPGKKPEDLLK